MEQQMTYPTSEDYRARLERSREEMLEKMDLLVSGSLTKERENVLIEEVRGALRYLKKEQGRMIGVMAEEAAYIDEIETRFKEIEHVRKKRFHLLPPAPTNAQIDYAEKKQRHFAQGKSFYKLFWVFFIGCFAGVIIERIWCYVRYGFYEPRVGLIYGPFNLVYGIGAWALTAALYPFRNRSRLISFLGGALVGSAVEYACSLFQEMIFGSVSWDYSGHPFNLNGRICLLYSIYWGVLGVLWIKELYPRMAKWILKIPNQLGKPLTIALLIFMIFNTLMTGASVLRWTERRQNVQANNSLETYLDAHYPDERMEAIFTNLVFAD